MIMKTTTEKLSLPFDYIAAHEFLTRNDPHLADVIARTGEFQFKLDECDSVYESLLEAIVHPEHCRKSRRDDFRAHQGARRRTASAPRRRKFCIRSQALRKAGLSQAKALAMKDLAQKTLEGVVPTLEDAQKMSDEELVERLISVRGIGPWTVEMFLIFRLGRPDVLPDPRLRRAKGLRDHLPQEENPQAARTAEFGERWRPWRTVASWYMWRAVQLAGQSRPQNH